MKCLLLGGTGQLGGFLQTSLLPVTTALAAPSSSQLDLRDLDAVRAAVRALRPQVLVNAAACTAVDRTETEPALAMRLNAELPGLLAEEMKRLGGALLHYSTEQVFDGSGQRPWRESDVPAPLNVYGRSKLAGEDAVLSVGGRVAIWRTSWLYGGLRSNFVGRILQQAVSQDALQVVSDQVGAPTEAGWLATLSADWVSGLARGTAHQGLLHVTACGEVSWFDHACRILEEARHQGIALRAGPDQVMPVSTAALALPAQRPLNCRLDGAQARRMLMCRQPAWDAGLPEAVNRLAMTIQLPVRQAPMSSRTPPATR